MAKTAKKAAEPTTDIILMEGVEKTIKIASDDLILNTIGSQKELDQIVETFSGFIITGIDDMVSYNATKDAAKKLQKLRTDVDKHRKSLTEPALKWQKDLKAVADKIIEQIKPVEEKLNSQIADIDDKRKALEKKLFTDRAKLLADAGFQLVGGSYICGPIHVPTESIIKLDEKEMDFYVGECKKEQERKAAADREYQERMDALNKLQADLDKKAKEIADAQALLDKKASELNAQEEAIEKTYEKIETTAEQPTDEAVEVAAPPVEDIDRLKQESSDSAVVSFSNDEAVENNEEQMHQANNSYFAGYTDGFTRFRLDFLEKMESPEKFTRAQLVEWAKNHDHNLF